MPQNQPFRLEREMLDCLEQTLPTALDLPSGRYWRLLREPSVGPVIPDILVGISRHEVRPNMRRRSTLAQTHILALLEIEGTLGTRQLARRLHLREESARSALAKLRK